jgi:hypothetical protein
MKPKKLKARLDTRIKDYELTLKSTKHPDMFSKPGSLNKKKTS